YNVTARPPRSIYPLSLHDALPILLYSCGKIEDPYVYDDGDAASIDWDAVASQSTDALIDQFWNAEGYFNYGSAQSDVGFQYWPKIGKHTSELQSRENLVCRLLLEK